MIDPEKDLHVAEVKIRLKPESKALLFALARKRDMPYSVLGRVLLMRELDALVISVPGRPANRRPA